MTPAPTHGDDGFQHLLALYRQTSASLAVSPCPRKRGSLLANTTTGQFLPLPCGVLTCHVCIVHTALGHAAAIASARPTEQVLLTQVGDEWGVIKKRFKQLRDTLCRRGSKGEYVYHVEQNPAGTGHHVHLWHWGAPLSEPLLREAARSAGMGAEATVRPMSTFPRYLAYGMKAVIERPDGATELWPAAREYLRLNGGWLHHQTRGYWRGPDGEPLGGIKAAVIAARRHLRGEAGSWIVTSGEW